MTYLRAKRESAMKTLIGSLVLLLVALGTADAVDQPPIFHGIKLGVSLGSQFQECPWNPPKEGEIPKYISPLTRMTKETRFLASMIGGLISN